MDFTLTVLGTASAKPGPGRNQSAQVLYVHGRSFLIDCGEGVQTRLQECRISPMKIDSIFISHIHGDHVFGLFGLLSTMGMLSRMSPLNIYAPVSFGPILKFFLSYYGDGIPFEIRHIPMNMKVPEMIYHTKSLEIYAFPLNHKIETFGWLFREKEPQMNVKNGRLMNMTSHSPRSARSSVARMCSVNILTAPPRCCRSRNWATNRMFLVPSPIAATRLRFRNCLPG